MALTAEQLQLVLEGRDIDAILQLIDEPYADRHEPADVVLYALRQLDALFFEPLAPLVVRLCVESAETTAQRVRHGFLSPWVRSEGHHHRQQMVELLLGHLGGDPGVRTVPALRTIWVIGYRTDAVVSLLEKLAGITGDGAAVPDDPEGYALAVLAWLGYADVPRLVGRLRARLSRRGHLDESDCWTAMKVATPDLIPALTAAASVPRSAATFALLDLSERHPEVTTDVWRAFNQLPEGARFGFSGRAAQRLDLEDVARVLAEDALIALQHASERNVLAPTNLLLSANLPTHLEFYARLPENLKEHQRRALRTTTVQSTGNTRGLRTVETMVKESAWDVVLRLGLPDARLWLPEAMAAEVSYTLVYLAQRAAFLHLEGAIEPLRRAITDEHRDLGVQLGCLRCLGALGTPAALDALLESRVRVRRGDELLVPNAQAEAMAAVCAATGSSSRVWEILADRSADHQLRETCAYALLELTGYADAPLPPPTRVVELLRPEGPDCPGFGALLLVLSHRPDDPVVADYFRLLASSGIESRELTRALALIGILGELPRRVSSLGFEYAPDGWKAPATLTDESAFALPYLYSRDQRFEQALVTVLENEPFRVAVHAVAVLPSIANVSDRVQAALLARATRLNGPTSSDSSSLEALAHLSPDVLLQSLMISEVSRWVSGARLAYLRALRHIMVSDPQRRTRVADVAAEFIRDDDSLVRRSAARLARDADVRRLGAVVEVLRARADGPADGIGVLEAAFWHASDWSRHVVWGLRHPEPIVRDHAERLDREHRTAQLSRLYAGRVLESSDPLQGWRYGQALIALGDEDALDRLYLAARDARARPYLEWLAKELEGRLEKRRKEDAAASQPPPLSQEQEIEITIEAAGQAVGPLRGTLRESHVRRAHGWSGSWAIRLTGSPSQIMNLARDDVATVLLGDGRRGEALFVERDVRSIGGGASIQVRLLGNGPLE